MVWPIRLWNICFAEYICVACRFKDINKQVLRVKLIRGKEKVFKSLKAFWKLKQLQKTRTTWFTWSSLLMMFRRTSGNSSFRRDRKIGRSCSIVASCIEDKVELRITFALNATTTMIRKKNAFEDLLPWSEKKNAFENNPLSHKRGNTIIYWKSTEN